MHEMPRARRHAHEVEQFHGERFRAFDGPCPANNSGRQTFSSTFMVGSRLKNWNTMPQVAAGRYWCERLFIRRVQGQVANEDFPRAGRVQPAEQVHERAFAAARSGR